MLSNTDPGEDFSLESTMVTFTASSVSGSMQCLDVMVIGDSGFESDETATFDLSTTSFAELGTVNSVTLTIMNDDDRKSKYIAMELKIFLYTNAINEQLLIYRQL